MADCSTIVIGIGNDFREDDAAGLEVARKVHAATLADTCVKESPGDITELVDWWSGHRRAIVIDAVQIGSVPGHIVQFNALEQPVPDVFLQHFSSHGMGVPDAIALAKTLGMLPDRLEVYGIEGKTFDMGHGMSAPVLGAVEEVAAAIIADLTGE